jgi:hypothetical protein
MIFVGQTNLRLHLITGQSLSGATEALVKYKKPDGTTGSWTGTVSGQSVDYKFTDGDLDAAGDWTVWAYVTFPSGISIGKSSVMKVYTESN